MHKLGVLVVLVPAIAHADGPIEVGVVLGGHAGSKSVELGVPDQMNEPGPSDGAAIGARGAYMFTTRLAVEGELVVIPTKDDVLGDRATVFGIRAHARFDLLTGRVRPFVVAGLGVHAIRSTSPQMDNDIDKSFHWGLGARYALTDEIDLRIDGRDLIVPDRTTNGATNDVEITAGVTWRFGARRPIRVVYNPLPPPPAPPPAPPPPVVVNHVITELAGIGFEIDSSTIDAASTPILDRAYEILAANPAITVEISGHTSSEGGNERNLPLSQRRADAVKDYLVRRGIAATRITAIGHGANLPIGDNATDEGRRKNRRIEFRIVTPDSH